MATNQISELVLHLRTAALRHDRAGQTDGELLECFIESRDEAAFAALVRRHGLMVWSVCRRLLAHHDADDAFQATFLVLVCKAASIVPREMVGNWLYGVALQTALQTRRTATRRRAKEVQVREMPDAAAVHQDQCPDVQVLLHQELSRLPDIYRSVVVLCDLEGGTRKEVARQLGVPEGTVAGRLARARALLAKRLAQRGVALSSGALVAVLTQNVASADVPTSLVASTLQAASHFGAGSASTGVVSVKVAALTERVLKAMVLKKLKLAGAVMLAFLSVSAVGSWLVYGQSEQPIDAPTVQVASKQQGENTAMKELEKLQGTWTAVSAEKRGNQIPEAELKQVEVKLVIDGEKYTIMSGGREGPKGEFKIDCGKMPKTIDQTAEIDGKQTTPLIGIYELDGNTLKWCYGKERPTEFRTKTDRMAEQRLYVFVRDKK